jgi:hypothetical protein
MDGSCERWEFVMCITAFAQPIFNRGLKATGALERVRDTDTRALSKRLGGLKYCPAGRRRLAGERRKWANERRRDASQAFVSCLTGAPP